MKKIILKLFIILPVFIFTACANIEVGFEEDSPFYSPPTSSKKIVANTSNINEEKKLSVEKNTITHYDKLSTTSIKKTNSEEENETTFYYEFVEE
ncbi:MAG: hypothetical protein HOF69_07510 [Campylobacteraceae bacterium]|jgi:hypothetical protein|nr:hypothetical protein [Campylobacteraceae bacterium]MBT3883091.1 hypothetical protein [Campylobacteraceae bacterium]MBT4178752.1 hypothetical protein [Campylobacteraceae bacterium]MBT4572722.1 hypothetical protein [Campylobacteraceae bacterium]MBT4708146.1 hypothetical protein [Campylobacteraceae bacterium]